MVGGTYNKPTLDEEGTRECPLAPNCFVKFAAFGYRVAPEVVSPGALQRDSLRGGSYH